MSQETIMRRIIVAALAALAASGADAAEKHIPPQETPVALFKAIYGQYPESEAADAWHKADKSWLGKGDISGLPGWESLPLSHDTAALQRRVDKAIGKSGEVCIDFDQLSDSQDPNIAQYRIVGPDAPATARADYDIYVKGTWRKDVTKIAYRLVKEDGKWRVDEIVNASRDDKGHVVKSATKAMLKACL
jgi:hypothetical protein